MSIVVPARIHLPIGSTRSDAHELINIEINNAIQTKRFIFLYYLDHLQSPLLFWTDNLHPVTRPVIIPQNMVTNPVVPTHLGLTNGSAYTHVWAHSETIAIKNKRRQLLFPSDPLLELYLVFCFTRRLSVDDELATSCLWRPLARYKVAKLTT